VTVRRILSWPVLLGVVAGSALQVQQSHLWPPQAYAGCILPAVLALVLSWLLVWLPPDGKFWRFWPRVPVGALTGLTALALAFGLAGWRASATAQSILDPALEGQDMAVTGVVSGLPQPFEQGLRFPFDVNSAALQGQPVIIPRQIDLAWYASPAVRAGQVWQFNVRLKAPHGGVNPHGFDFELWQWERGVQATGYVRNGKHDPLPQRLDDSWRYPVQQARQWVRARIEAHLPDARQVGLIAALVVGDQAAIERADWDVFRATGVAHLMSISGLHITLFAWLAALLIRGVWRRSAWLCLRWPAPHAALLGGLVLAAGYALFSGWGVPAQRTVWMLASVTLLRLTGLRWPWPQVWLLACAVVVLADPYALLQAGFWLSFVAVGILFASDSGLVNPASPRAVRWLMALCREQMVITLALAPLTLLLFGQVSLVGLLANLLAIPWVTLLVTPLAMLGVLVPTLWDVAATAAGALTLVLQTMAAWPLAVWQTAQAPWWMGMAAVLGGVLWVAPLPPSLRCGGLSLVLPVLLWTPPVPTAGQFEVLAVDVGQGSAVLVRTASHALLFDAGPRYSADSDAGHRVLVPLLRALGVRLDTLVLSHSDSDHIGGAASVLAAQAQAHVLSSVDPTEFADRSATVSPTDMRPVRNPADSSVSSTPVAYTRCEAGQQWGWDGVTFELLNPAAEDFASARNVNALSCVLRIRNAAQTVLLTGDIERAQEARLVKAGTDLRADLLLVPHHGSKTSSSDDFLDAVQPRFALVQAGYRNRFGHPAGPVMVRYAQRGIAVVDTPHCGAIHWSSARAQQVQCQRDMEPHYWRHRVP